MAYIRTITIGDRDVSRVAAGCTFKWKADTGCDSATITLPASTSLDFAGIEFDDVVVIEWNTETWWTGIVTDLNESAISGLTIQCSGKGSTLLKETQAFGKYGTEVLIPRIGPDNISYNLVFGEGKLGLGPGGQDIGYHTYCVTPLDSEGERISGHQTALSFHSAARTSPPYNSEYTIKKAYNGSSSGPPGSHYRTVSLSKGTLVTNNTTLASIELSWADDSRVAAWRVYKLLTTAQKAAAVGIGSEDTPANISESAVAGFYYVEVTTPEFVDDGAVDWAALPSLEIDDELFDTCRTPTIVDTGAPYAPNTCSVRSAVRHLVKTLLDDDGIYNVDKIVYGTDAVLDDLDYDTDRATLYDALDTLANYAGGARFGIDYDGDFYFYAKAKLGDASDLVVRRDSVEGYSDTAVDDITRSITRDGATTVDVSLSEIGQAWVPVSTVETDTSKPRKEGVAVVAHGVRTQDAVDIIAANVAADHKENFGTWTVKLSNVSKLIKASDIVSVVHGTTTYAMEVKSADYSFNDVVSVTLSCGEPDIYDKQVKQQSKAITSTVRRNTFHIPTAGKGNPATALSRLTPVVCTTLKPTTGSSEIPASIDHTHGYSPDPANALLLTAEAHPLIARLHRGAGSVEALQKRVDETDSTYVNGLAFAVGDLAVIGATLYKCTSVAVPAGTWDQLFSKDDIADIGDDLLDDDDFMDDLSAALDALGWRLAKLESLNADGDHINVYFWDFDADPPAYETATTSISRPYALQATVWSGNTLVTADGRSIQYDVTGVDIDYQRNAVCATSGKEFEVIEEMQPPYYRNGLLLVKKDPAGNWVDTNGAGRTYVISYASLLADIIDELPDPTDDQSYVPLLYKAKVASLDSGGDLINVYPWNYATSAWAGSTVAIAKPAKLRYSKWSGGETNTDSTAYTYNTTSLNRAYQRRALWTSGGTNYSEVQAITPAYSVGEELRCMQDRYGDLFDMNEAGRCWAKVEGLT